MTRPSKRLVPRDLRSRIAYFNNVPFDITIQDVHDLLKNYKYDKDGTWFITDQYYVPLKELFVICADDEEAARVVREMDGDSVKGQELICKRMET